MYHVSVGSQTRAGRVQALGQATSTVVGIQGQGGHCYLQQHGTLWAVVGVGKTVWAGKVGSSQVGKEGGHGRWAAARWARKVGSMR